MSHSRDLMWLNLEKEFWADMAEEAPTDALAREYLDRYWVLRERICNFYESP